MGHSISLRVRLRVAGKELSLFSNSVPVQHGSKESQAQNPELTCRLLTGIILLPWLLMFLLDVPCTKNTRFRAIYRAMQLDRTITDVRLANHNSLLNRWAETASGSANQSLHDLDDCLHSFLNHIHFIASPIAILIE